MKLQLNGWRRIGVVASSIWIVVSVGFAAYQLHVADVRDYIRTGQAPLFVRFSAEPPLADDFFQRFSQRESLEVDSRLLTLREAVAFVDRAHAEVNAGRVVAWVTLPVLIGWPILEALALSLRWIRRGFRPSRHSASDGVAPTKSSTNKEMP